MTPTARFLIGDVFDVMATLPDQSVDLVLTSPPFLTVPAGDLVTTRCHTCPDEHPQGELFPEAS